jgi:ketosteroid isomerase-like protein
MAGQDWSAEQKAVWQVIEDSNAAWAAGDLEGVYENTHADFTWWTYVTAAPGNRAAAMSYDGANIGRNKVVATDVQPLTVQVYDTFAVVHYYARSLSENADGERNFQEARVTDVFKKENGRWMLVANHWGDVSALE